MVLCLTVADRFSASVLLPHLEMNNPAAAPWGNVWAFLTTKPWSTRAEKSTIEIMKCTSKARLLLTEAYQDESFYSRANLKTNMHTRNAVVGFFFWAKARWRDGAGYSAIDNASITYVTIHEVTMGAAAPS